MKILTRQDVYPAFRYLYFEMIEAQHLINPLSWEAGDYLFIAGNESWERKIIKIDSIKTEEDNTDPPFWETDNPATEDDLNSV